MKIRDMQTNSRFTLSFEVFPPKREGNIEHLYTAIRDLKVFRPHFISVTYGAGGSTRDKTVEIASTIKNDLEIEALAHLTCVQSTRREIAEVLGRLREHNIENVLALRGDPPQEEQEFVQPEGGFGYASELVEFIAAESDLSIGVAGYPEKHPEAVSMEADLANLKRKVTAGANFIITQICFDNDMILRYRERVMAQGITVPIKIGIFPIFNYKQIQKMASLCGATIPSALHEKLYRVSEKDEEVEKYGIEYAIGQSEKLLTDEIEGLHFYSMNRSAHVKEVVSTLSLPKHSD